jgi:phenylalanyl-tRNA synthetase beta chain
MLQVAAHNIHNGRPDIQLFEFGRAYFRGHRSDAPVSGYIEEERLGLLLSGRVTRQTWNQSATAFDIYDAKGLAVDVMRNMGVSYVESIQPQPEHGAQYRITWHTPEGYWLGTALEVAPATRGAFDIDVPVFYIELRVDLQADRAATRYEPISRFPQVVRDIAVTVGRDQAVGPMLAAIRASGGPLLRNVDVFDVYEGDRIGADLKSIAFSLSFGADRTLVDDEVDRAVSETVTSLSTLFGAILRA